MPITHDQYVTPSADASASKPPIGTGMVLMGFSVICLITSFIFSFDKGEELKIQAPATGKAEGHPFSVPKDNAVYVATITQNPGGLPNNSGWSDIEIEIMDKEETSLFSFGGDIWRASGRDSDGSWSETKSRFKMKFTVPEKGEYLIGVSAENNARDIHAFNSNIKMTIQRKTASSLPFMIAGIFAFIAGVIIGYINNYATVNETLAAMSD
jgi:hypothetical protein